MKQSRGARNRKRSRRVTVKMTDRVYYVYIAANARRTVLYTGVTSALKRRIWQHKQKITVGFASRNNATQLVYYETSSDPRSAIAREKQIKAGSRAKKIGLIEQMNPTWCDLYDEI
jgi:putative endonuclease